MKKQILLFFSFIFILMFYSFSKTFAITQGKNYTSSTKCNSALDEYNDINKELTRSSCVQTNGGWTYFQCDSCSIKNEEPKQCPISGTNNLTNFSGISDSKKNSLLKYLKQYDNRSKASLKKLSLEYSFLSKKLAEKAEGKKLNENQNYSFGSYDKSKCENSIKNRFNLKSAICTIGGGCGLSCGKPSSTCKSANPKAWGFCGTINDMEKIIGDTTELENNTNSQIEEIVSNTFYKFLNRRPAKTTEGFKWRVSTFKKKEFKTKESFENYFKGSLVSICKNKTSDSCKYFNKNFPVTASTTSSTQNTTTDLKLENYIKYLYLTYLNRTEVDSGGMTNWKNNFQIKYKYDINKKEDRNSYEGKFKKMLVGICKTDKYKTNEHCQYFLQNFPVTTGQGDENKTNLAENGTKCKKPTFAHYDNNTTCRRSCNKGYTIDWLEYETDSLTECKKTACENIKKGISKDKAKAVFINYDLSNGSNIEPGKDFKDGEYLPSDDYYPQYKGSHALINGIKYPIEIFGQQHVKYFNFPHASNNTKDSLAGEGTYTVSKAGAFNSFTAYELGDFKLTYTIWKTKEHKTKLQEWIRLFRVVPMWCDPSYKEIITKPHALSKSIEKQINNFSNGLATTNGGTNNQNPDLGTTNNGTCKGYAPKGKFVRKTSYGEPTKIHTEWKQTYSIWNDKEKNCVYECFDGYTGENCETLKPTWAPYKNFAFTHEKINELKIKAKEICKNKESNLLDFANCVVKNMTILRRETRHNVYKKCTEEAGRYDKLTIIACGMHHGGDDNGYIMIQDKYKIIEKEFFTEYNLRTLGRIGTTNSQSQIFVDDKGLCYVGGFIKNVQGTDGTMYNTPEEFIITLKKYSNLEGYEYGYGRRSWTCVNGKSILIKNLE